MLNEIKEYEQYTDASVGSSEIVNSLKYKLFADSFSGMEQAMVTVARHFLFDGSNEYTAETIAAAENALRLWCGGHDESINEKTEALRNWLPTYIKQQLLYEKVQSALFDKRTPKEPDSIPNPIPETYLREIRGINNLLNAERTCAQNADHMDKQLQEYAAKISTLKEAEKIDANTFDSKISPIVTCIDKMMTVLESKRKSYAKNLFHTEANAYEAGNNDFKAITYDRIIATGCNTGALRRYYLYCDDENVINSVYRSGKIDSPLKPKEKDVLLKTVAAWLLGGSRPDDSVGSAPPQNYHPINRAAVINWTNKLSFYDDFKKYLDSFRLKNGEQTEIFSTVNLGRNFTKLAVIIQTPPKASKDSEKESKVQFGTWFDHFSLKRASDPEADQKMFEEWKKANPNGVFFRDEGAGSFLVKNEVYS